jgi:hypothetical protein
MTSKFAESRNLNQMLAVGLSDEARKAVNAAFDAISTWRTETVNTSDKNLERVIDKLATAARALGWPEEIVDSARAQIEGDQSADSNDGSNDGCLGGADKITEFVIGYAIQTKILA